MQMMMMTADQTRSTLHRALEKKEKRDAEKRERALRQMEKIVKRVAIRTRDREIRRLYRSGEATREELSEQYGLTLDYIRFATLPATSG